MGDTWATDIRHFLEEGCLHTDMPTQALNLVLHVGSIVAWMTSRDVAGVERTNVPCRRSPGRKRCGADIEAALEEAGAVISWCCPICGDNGYIRGWQGTQWDRRPSDPPRRPAPLKIIEGLGGQASRKQIRPDERVSVKLTAGDKRIMEELILDPEYMDRLHPSGKGYVGEYTLDDLEDIIGYVAAEANHTTSKKKGRSLDNLYERLLETQRSYDDGSWNDSEP